MAGHCTHCGGSGFRRPSREIAPVPRHSSTLCQAITGYGHSYQVPWVQRCQQKGTHTVDGVLLCGAHFNAAFRKPLTIVGELRQLGDGDILGNHHDTHQTR